MSIIGHISVEPNGDLTLELSECQICGQSHRTPIIHAEHTFCIHGEPRPYWTTCPTTSKLILLGSAVGDTIAATIMDPPLRSVLRKSK